MGDGISDLVIRGEANEEAERDHILSRIQHSDGVWITHKHSQSYLVLWRTIRTMQAERLVDVEVVKDWRHITIADGD